MYRSKIAPPILRPNSPSFASVFSFAQAGNVCLWCHSSGPHQRRGNGDSSTAGTAGIARDPERDLARLAWLTVEMFSWCGFQD